MYVKIINSNPDVWYYKKEEDIFEVKDTSTILFSCYQVVETGNYIHTLDCIVLDEKESKNKK